MCIICVLGEAKMSVLVEARVCSRGGIVQNFSNSSEGSMNTFAVLDGMISRDVMVTLMWGDGSRDQCWRWLDKWCRRLR